MKNWKWLVTILVLALLAVYIWIGAGYFGQKKSLAEHHTELSGLNAALAMMPEISTDLDEKLEAAQAELTETEKLFATEANETEIVDTILQLAEEAGVKGVPLSTQPWVNERISNHDFNVFYLTLEVTGDFQHLQNYLELLENSELTTMAVTYVKATRVSADTDADMTANLDIAVYVLAAAED